MGRQIPTRTFSHADFVTFKATLRRQVPIAINRLGSSNWASDRLDLGDETEATGVRLSTGQPFMQTYLLAELLGSRWTTELGCMNIEHGSRVVSQLGRPYNLLSDRLTSDYRVASRVMEPLDATLLFSGIAPSLRPGHARRSHLVPEPRYQALNDQLQIRYGPVNLDLHVRGAEPLRYRSNGIGIESFTNGRQAHVSACSGSYRDWHNAGIMTAFVGIGLSGFSPFLFGRQVSYGDVRGNVFEAAVRGRGNGFGTGWLESVSDIFTDCLEQPVLLPIMSGRPDEDLMELTLHLGSLYPWLRLVLGKYLRCEYRYLPAAPIPDMIANDAAVHGLNRVVSHVIAGWIREYGDELFKVAADNFNAARDFGATARVFWPIGNREYTETTPAQVFLMLADQVVHALEGQGINDADWAIDPILRRACAGQNGSSVLLRIARQLPLRNRMGQLTKIMASLMEVPVIDWP